MPRLHLGWALTAGVLALAPGARGADHQYFATLVTDDQAVLIDLATRSRRADTVAFDLIILQRQPSQATGSPTYWVDGVQEVDCVGHRSRIMLISALSLDRQRKVNSPGAAFRPWSANAQGSDGRAVEEFVCNDARGPRIRAVADLTSFQKDYFQRGPALATGPSVPPPAPGGARPPTISPPPANAPRPPQVPARGAYYMVGQSDQGTMFLRPSSASAFDGVVTVPMVTLMGTPLKMEGGMVATWGDGDAVVDCRQHRWRMAVRRVVNLERSQSEDVSTGRFTDWTPIIPGSAMQDGETLLCSERAPAGLIPVDDLVAYARQRQTAAAAPSRASPTPAGQLSAAPTGAGMAAPTVATATYYVVGKSEQGSLLVKPSAAVVGDGFVNIPIYILMERPPQAASGLIGAWGDGDAQIDCRQHRWRLAMGYLRNLDRTRSESIFEQKFADWLPIAPGTGAASAEALMCNNRIASGVAPVNDLAAYGRQQQASAGPPPRAPAPATAAATSSARTDYRMAEVGKDGALLVDRASVKRQNDIVTFSTLDLFAVPEKLAGGEFWWATVTSEIDCQGHRYRDRIETMMNKDRTVRRAIVKPEFSAWAPSGRETMHSMLEDYVCRNKGAENFDAVADVDKFQTQVLAAITGGAFK